MSDDGRNPAQWLSEEELDAKKLADAEAHLRFVRLRKALEAGEASPVAEDYSLERVIARLRNTKPDEAGK